MNMPTVSDLIPGSENAITLEKVAVRYRVPRERVSGIKEFTIRWIQQRLAFDNFWALHDISFQVPPGEVFGIIGRNGSGKSTLLKVVARVLHPTQGRLVLRGRVAPLLELGAGFHSELTGRENIFLNSALLGRTRVQVQELLPEIIDFAEIGEFIDAPLRTYSTGMVARLGFSVATCVRPEILLVDEVLSVGDAQFARKCLDRMYSFQAQGTTILIVSHSMTTIETFCDRALWLHHGQAMALGSVRQVIEEYIRLDQPEKTHIDTPAPARAAHGQLYQELEGLEQVYPVSKGFDIQQGTLAVWIKYNGDQPLRDCMIFHTDDSRYILYMGSYYDEVRQEKVYLLIARAGGNRQVIDTYFGTSSFSEISAALNPADESLDFGLTPDEWHLVTLTWNGYPDGNMRLYLDGSLVGERSYDHRYDDGRPLPTEFAIGMRPAAWLGELIEGEDGSLQDRRPDSTLPIQGSGVEIRGMRLYSHSLGVEDVLALYQWGQKSR